jgi:acetylornithine deacetylase/succinyl-diaminopimelate desuccinylase-like protein
MRRRCLLTLVRPDSSYGWNGTKGNPLRMAGRSLIIAFLVGLLLSCFLQLPVQAQEEGARATLDWEQIGDEAVATLSKYLRINTTNPPGNEIEAAEFLGRIFDREGIRYRIFQSQPGRASIYAHLSGDGSKRPIILLSHMDVVAADPSNWEISPFSGAIKDGYIWGRGALDMKGMGIVELMSLLALKRQQAPLKRDVIFLATADEEAGGRLGAGWFVQNHWDLIKDAEYLITEFGWIFVEDGRVKYYAVDVAEKAPCWLKISFSGTPGHGSMPRTDTSVNRLIHALERVLAYQTPLRVVPPVDEYFATLALLEDPPKRGLMANIRQTVEQPKTLAPLLQIPYFNAILRNTISVTVLEGSSKTNVIPPTASAHLDCRLLPGQDPGEFIGQLKRVIDDPSVQIERLLNITSSASPTDTEFYRIVSRVIKDSDATAVVAPMMLSGFTDSHYFRERGITCYGFVPFKVSFADLGRIHGNNERVSVENVKLGTRMLYEMLVRLCR